MNAKLRFSFSLAIVCYCLLILFRATSTCSQYAGFDDYADYVKEVVEEDYRNGEDYENPYATDADDQNMRKRKEEEESRRIAEEERLVRERAERIQREREAQFEAEVSRMSEDKRKAAKRQKRRDAKIVTQVLKAARHGDHYAVLGLRNWEFTIPARAILLAPKFKLSIPGLNFFHIKPSKIKKAYHRRAIAVHPDKNRDGRANEAFIAVENSASLLLDDKLRAEYDESVRIAGLERRKNLSKKAADGRNMIFGSMSKGFRVVRSVLGPFAFPSFVLGAIII